MAAGQPMKMVNGEVVPLEGEELDAHLAKQELPYQQGIFLARLREDRDARLAASDISSRRLADFALLGRTDETSLKALAAYRQDLRDMPAMVETSDAWADLATTADLAAFRIPWPVAP